MIKHSLIATQCLWCDIGQIFDNKCQSCGATYVFGRKQKLKNNISAGFILPTVREANLTHLEKDKRSVVRRKKPRAALDRRRNP